MEQHFETFKYFLESYLHQDVNIKNLDAMAIQFREIEKIQYIENLIEELNYLIDHQEWDIARQYLKEYGWRKAKNDEQLIWILETIRQHLIGQDSIHFDVFTIFLQGYFEPNATLEELGQFASRFRLGVPRQVSELIQELTFLIDHHESDVASHYLRIYGNNRQPRTYYEIMEMLEVIREHLIGQSIISYPSFKTFLQRYLEPNVNLEELGQVVLRFLSSEPQQTDTFKEDLTDLIEHERWSTANHYVRLYNTKYFPIHNDKIQKVLEGIRDHLGVRSMILWPCFKSFIEFYDTLLRNGETLDSLIQIYKDLDNVQEIPALINELTTLIDQQKWDVARYYLATYDKQDSMNDSDIRELLETFRSKLIED